MGLFKIKKTADELQDLVDQKQNELAAAKLSRARVRRELAEAHAIGANTKPIKARLSDLNDDIESLPETISLIEAELAAVGRADHATAIRGYQKRVAVDIEAMSKLVAGVFSHLEKLMDDAARAVEIGEALKAAGVAVAVPQMNQYALPGILKAVHTALYQGLNGVDDLRSAVTNARQEVESTIISMGPWIAERAGAEIRRLERPVAVVTSDGEPVVGEGEAEQWKAVGEV